MVQPRAIGIYIKGDVAPNHWRFGPLLVEW